MDFLVNLLLSCWAFAGAGLLLLLAKYTLEETIDRRMRQRSQARKQSR